MFRLRIFLSLCFIFYSIFVNSLVTADIVVIANKSTVIKSLDKKQAQKLWLGDIHKLPGTGKIKVLDQPNSSAIKEEFYEKLMNKTLSQLKVHWAKKIFAGKSVPPRSLSSDKKVLEAVIKNNNVLGYVYSESVSEDVNVLMTIQ